MAPKSVIYFQNDRNNGQTNEVSALDSSMNSLSLKTIPSSRPTSSAKHQQIAESWDAADSDDESSLMTSKPTVVSGSRPPPQLSDYPSAPPPTPVAPQQWQNTGSPFQGIDFNKDSGSRVARRRAESGDSAGARPEKTNAVAGRLIAGALGVKAPRRTEDQRAYDKAMKEKETKRRDNEREQKKLDEERRVKAKRDIWDG